MSYAAGAAVADYNQDGIPDIFLANNESHTSTEGDGAVNRLYLSTGAWGTTPIEGLPYPLFVESSAAWKVPADDVMHFAPSAADFDKDGDIDLYVCLRAPEQTIEECDITRNILLVNKLSQGLPEFQEEAAAFQVDDNGNGYGTAWGDSDNDGDLDLVALPALVWVKT